MKIFQTALAFGAATMMLTASVRAASFPSPSDWRDENIYQILTDRFYDGDQSNDYAETNRGVAYAPTNSKGIHGGDFKGIQQKLDYIKSLGATAIWISPLVLNVSGSAYHGYGGQDFYTLAPHWGTLTDLSNMVSAAHARGIKVMLDIVVNHSGVLLNSSDSGWANFKYPGTYNLKYISSSNVHAAPWLTNSLAPTFPSIFHPYGNIQNFSDNNQVEKGQLSGLNDFATDTTYVRTNMANIYRYWIQTGDLDGFRIDTVKHVDHGNGGFWNYWCPQIHNFATSIGKTNFFMFGEVYDGSDQKNGYYTGTMLSTNFALDATLDYPLYFMVNGIFATATANSQQIESHYSAISTYYDPASWYRLVTFLDNHDQPRFLSSGNANNNTNRLAVALAFLYTSRGVPCLYYGTEQAFNGSGDPNNREDMFAGRFKDSGQSSQDSFNETHPMFRYVALLNNLRRNYPALRRGDHINQWNSPSGPGLFAYSRILQSQEVFVVFNTAASTQTLPARTLTYPQGTVLVNLLNTNETITVQASSQTPSISVPSTTAKIFIDKSQFVPFDPVVLSVTPAHSTTNVSATAAVVLKFSKPMDTNSVQSAFSLLARPGSFTWSTLHDTMTFTPSTALTGMTNIVRVATNATDAVDGKTLVAPFESAFLTAGSAQADTTPPTVTIVSPTNTTMVTGTLNISGTANDNQTVAKVEVQLDGGNWTMASGTTSWSLSLDSTKFLNGSHNVSARSTDNAGNVSAVDSRTVRFFNVPNGYLTRISAGNPSSVTDCSNNVWVADQAYSLGSFGYSGGSTGFVANTITGICTQAQSLYQRERYSDSTSSFRYLFDCPEGVYETTLLEAETWTNAPNGRVFNVFIENQQVLTNYDIFAVTGGKNVPDTEVFTNVCSDAQLEILFSAITDNARASGIQVRKIADLDTDGDGIPDWWMLAYFDHPTGQSGDNSCASCDASGDGLTNLQKFLGGLSPLTSNSTSVAASFAAAPTSGTAPLVVNFTDTSTGPITNRVWSFGDGGTISVTGTNVQHTYTAAGTNTVQLIVAGVVGNFASATQSNYIVVGAPPVPAAPSNLAATPVYENQIALVWHDNSTNEDAFVLQRGPGAGGPWTTIASVAAGVTNATDCALTGGSAYYYQVVATNSFGPSLPSNVAIATTPMLNTTMAFDRASDAAYASGWPNASNGGFGFGAWTLVQSSAGGASNGFFVGSSLYNGNPTGGVPIDSCGDSWGLYANNTANAVAYRTLATPLGVGQSLRWRMDNGWITGGSSVGIVLRTGNATGTVNDYNNGARFEFLFIGGTNNYHIVDAAGRRDTGVGYSTEALELTFTLTGTNTYAFHVARLANNSTADISGTLNGTAGSTIDSLALYNRNAGLGGTYDVFFNYLRRDNPNLDSVGDGIPNWWRALNFPGVDATGMTTNSVTCASCDPDGDGQSNLAEFLAGTSPTDATSVFAITDITIAGADIAVSWNTLLNKTNQLQRVMAVDGSPTWSDVGPLTIGTGGPVTQIDVGAATNLPSLFYRVRLVP